MDCSLGSSNPLLQEFDIHGAIEFKMDDRTYRMIPLANSEDYMYRKGTLSKAKQVCSLVTSINIMYFANAGQPMGVC